MSRTDSGPDPEDRDLTEAPDASVTAQGSVEAEAAQTLRRQAQILEQVRDGVVCTGRGGVIETWSAAAGRLRG